jgi:hypothetical protein
VGQSLLDAATRHRGGREATDDVTLLAFRYCPPPARPVISDQSSVVGVQKDAN